jgi:hypothetical protein
VLALASAGGVVAANAGIAIAIYVPYATVGAILVHQSERSRPYP